MSLNYFVQEELLPIVFIVFVSSLLVRMFFFLISQLRRLNEYRAAPKQYALNLLQRLVPYHIAFKKAPLRAASKYIFHICLLAVPIWYSGHIPIWEESQLHWTWTAIPDVWIDWMTIVVILLGALFLLKKIIRHYSGVETRFSEWIILIVTVSPFFTGYLYTNRLSLLAEGGFFMSNIELIHVLSGEALMLMIAFLSLTVRIHTHKCTGCTSCVINCPADAIACRENGLHRKFNYQSSKCIICATCATTCPEDAIELKHQFAFSSLFKIRDKQHLGEVEMKKCDLCGALFTALPLAKDVSSIIDNNFVAYCNDCKQTSALEMLNR